MRREPKIIERRANKGKVLGARPRLNGYALTVYGCNPLNDVACFSSATQEGLPGVVAVADRLDPIKPVPGA